MPNAAVLEKHSSLSVTLNARVVALRWDLVEWGLVLDLDAPVSEGKNAPLRRVWLVFLGLSDIHWPFVGARLPNGCWLSSGITVSPADGESEFNFKALLPRFRDDGSMEASPSQPIGIRAQRLIGVASERVGTSVEGGLSRADRIALATDEEMLSIVTSQIQNRAAEDCGA